MSGKAKTAQKKGAPKPPTVKVTKVLEFRRTSRGALAPKYRWEREVQS